MSDPAYLISAPRVTVSKSSAQALGCEHYFLNRLNGGPEPVTPYRETGALFHRYYHSYIQHLRETSQPRDDAWVREWLHTGTGAADPAAVALIADHSDRFEINPAAVFATELYLGVNARFESTEYEETDGDRRTPQDPATLYHGQLDLLEIEGDWARITDAKTGWAAPDTVSDYEAAHYAALVFAHFPYITTVDFRWDFVRAVPAPPLTFERSGAYEWIQEEMRATARRMEALAARADRGEPVRVDPTAGLCAYCRYRCPLRDEVSRPRWDHPPLQTPTDAIAFAKRLYLAGQYWMRGREELKKYLDSHGDLELGNGVVAAIEASSTQYYPLDRVLAALGVDAPVMSPRWRIPLRALRVATSELKAKAATLMRVGLAQALEQLAEKAPRYELHIGKRRAHGK